jgi:hypothetical protein
MMKKTLTLLILMITLGTNAQEKGLFNNNKKINTTPISSIKSTAGASMYIVGIGNIKTKAVISGGTSRNKIKADDLTFVMNFGEKIVDDFDATTSYSINSPNDILLFKLEKKSTERRLIIGTVGTFSGSAIGINSSEAIHFDYTSMGNGKYEVTLPNNLKNGEYAFIHSQWTGVYTKMWAFTVIESKYVSQKQRDAEKMAAIKASQKKKDAEKMAARKAKKEAKKEAKN